MSDIYSFLLFLFNWTSVRVVCPIHEVTKPQTGTSLYLGYVVYCYVAIIYASPRLLSFPYDVRLMAQPTPAPLLTQSTSTQSIPTQDHLPNWEFPVSVPAYRKPPHPLPLAAQGTPLIRVLHVSIRL